MALAKSYEEYKLIAALLSDVCTSHSEVFNRRALRLTTAKVAKRVQEEGIGFLTKTMPRLAKALDRALTGDVPLDCTGLRLSRIPNTKLPRFLGEFFERVFSHDGRVLLIPCVDSVRVLRQILYLFYKYELPYSPNEELAVLTKFEKTEQDLQVPNSRLEHCAHCVQPNGTPVRRSCYSYVHGPIVRRARIRLQRLFARFDPADIYPRHGPGAVSTKEKLWGKYQWTSISPRVIATYPLDAYFYASLGHVCDSLDKLQAIEYKESYAQVVLVPKDSRGPRLISEEPLTFQWIQQGLGRAIMRHVERHRLTKGSVNFTDQQMNRSAALKGSLTGELCTLDLNEASDRVSVGLVNLLFPEPLKTALMNCRSLGTTLPCGKKVTLQKFAPMGSALCFPVLALTVWSLLTAGCDDAYLRKQILVYGDDVVVPKAYASDAMNILESFGLKINRDKSCTSGFFRESCGLDAFNGEEVTPVRIRTVWSSAPSPEVYTSWIATANQMYKLKYYNCYDLIIGWLHSVYGELPSVDMNLTCPSLVDVPEAWLPRRRRNNKNLQRLEYYVRDVQSRTVMKELDGWSMLLRFFAESCSKSELYRSNITPEETGPAALKEPFSVRLYTKRRATKLVRRWR